MNKNFTAKMFENENMCETCVYNYGFCDCSIGITNICLDDKGNNIVCACTLYEKDNGQYLQYLKENNKEY